MQVRIWDLNQFPTYEAAVAGGARLLSSVVFPYTQRLSIPPQTTDTYMDNFTMVPEPTAFLLAVPRICAATGVESKAVQAQTQRQ
jgi:hypothetical protein